MRPPKEFFHIDIVTSFSLRMIIGIWQTYASAPEMMSFYA